MVSNHKIDIMIAGAQKSGTTSFMNLLAKHPQLCSHTQKEFPFFVNNLYYKKGILQYWKEYFYNCESDSHLLVKSAGLMYSERALRRLKKHNPEVKLILILRNPVERAYSAYWYARRKGWESIVTFDEALDAGIDRFGNKWLSKIFCNYKDRGKYAEYISTIYSIFPRSNVFLYKFEDFIGKELEVCSDVWQKMQLQEIEDMHVEKRQYNSAAMPKFRFFNELLIKFTIPENIKDLLPMKFLRKMKDGIISLNERSLNIPPINSKTRKKLIEYYQQPNMELSKITGWDLKDWDS